MALRIDGADFSGCCTVSIFIDEMIRKFLKKLYGNGVVLANCMDSAGFLTFPKRSYGRFATPVSEESRASKDKLKRCFSYVLPFTGLRIPVVILRDPTRTMVRYDTNASGE